MFVWHSQKFKGREPKPIQITDKLVCLKKPRTEFITFTFIINKQLISSSYVFSYVFSAVFSCIFFHISFPLEQEKHLIIITSFQSLECIIQSLLYGLHCMYSSCLTQSQRHNFLLNWTMKLYSFSSHCFVQDVWVCMSVCAHLYRLWVIEMVAQVHQYLRHPVWNVIGAWQDARTEAEHSSMAPH